MKISYNNIVKEGEAKGHGPISLTFSAIDKAVGKDVVIKEFEIVAATPGRDAVGVVNIKALINENTFAGTAASTDIVNAAARAYLDALNKSEQSVS